MDRSLKGFLLAPPVGATASLLIMEGVMGLVALYIAVPVSYFLAVFIGLPIYAVMKHFAWLTLSKILIITFLISAAPWFLLALSVAEYSTVGGVVISENGQYTPEGLMQRAKFIGMLGLCGSLSGYVFWWISIKSQEL